MKFFDSSVDREETEIPQEVKQSPFESIQEQTEREKLQGHENWVHGIHLNENYIFSASYESTVNTWKLEKGKYSLLSSIKPFTQKSRIACVKESNDSVIFAGEDNYEYKIVTSMKEKPGDNYVYGYTIDENPKKIWEIQTNHLDLIYSIDVHKNYVFCGSRDYTCSMWDINDAKEKSVFKGHQEWITWVQYNENLFTSSRDGTIRETDVESGKCLCTYKDGVSFVGVYKCSASGLVFGANDNGIVYAFDQKSGKKVKEYKGHNGYTFNCQTTKDGKKLYSISKDKLAVEWDVVSMKPIKKYSGHKDAIRSFSIYDDKVMVTGSFDKTINVYDL